MIFAHLPAGYILSRAVKARSGPVFWAALLGSVFPDFDMLWFHLVDHASVHHHRYWVHIPGFWAVIAAICLPALAQFRPRAFLPAAVFFASIMLHLVLDSFGGGILWLWPFSTQLYSLITVPPTHTNWVLSFLLHWSFLAEIAIIAAALWLFFTRKRLNP